MIKQSKGITLIVLVITIIILLILAGISIQAITNTGIFTSASQAKQETQRAQVTEWLNLKLIEEQANNPTETAEKIIEATRVASYGNAELAKMGKKVVVDENTSTIEDGEEVTVYFYVQVDEDVYKVEMAGAKFVGEAGKFPSAIIDLSTTNTTTIDSITATITHIANESEIKIANCKWVYNTISNAIGTDESKYTGGTFSNNPQTITLSATTAGTYYLHILTTDIAGRIKETVSNGIIVEKKSAVYGTSIQSNYGTLYTTNYPNGFTEKSIYDNYHSGNYDRSRSLFFNQREKRLDRSADDQNTYIYTGTNKINFIDQIANNWVGILFHCAYYTSSVYISDVKLNFSDNSSIVVNEAVEKGYIEPLVVCASTMNYSSCIWSNINNILQGGSSGSANFPMAVLEFKVKNKAKLTGFSFYTNCNWYTPSDGILVYKYYEDYEISIEPIQ